MKLVRISKDAIIDIDDVQFAIWDDEDQKVKIEFKSTNTYLYTKDKKALDAICGSEEHLEDSENKYNISITTNETGINKTGSKSEVIRSLIGLKADEVLAIRLV